MSARRYYRRNRFQVYAGDAPVPGVNQVYRDAMGIKITRFHRSDGGDFAALFGDGGTLTVVMIDRADQVARAFKIGYEAVLWDPVHLSSKRDQQAEEAVVLSPTGDWSMMDLEESHPWMLAMKDPETEAPAASTLVKPTPPKKPTKKSHKKK